MMAGLDGEEAMKASKFSESQITYVLRQVAESTALRFIYNQGQTLQVFQLTKAYRQISDDLPVLIGM